jgi:hypothetical protein
VLLSDATMVRTLNEAAGTFSLIEMYEMQLDHTMQVVERLVEGGHGGVHASHPRPHPSSRRESRWPRRRCG